MRAQAFRVLLAAGCILAPAAPVLAQSSMAWTDRVRVSVNAGLQSSSVGLGTSATNTTYLENAIIESTATIGGGPMFDGGVAVRIVRNLGLGVSVSSFNGTFDAAVSATLPHPFFFSTIRAIAGTAQLEREELAAHVQAVFVVPVGRRIDIAVEGGPSWFSVSQDLVVGVAYTEDYPYDEASFSSATVSRVKRSQLGFNAGADVAVHLTRHFGLGAMVRYSRASVELAGANSVSVTVDAGGLQVGGGLRVFF